MWQKISVWIKLENPLCKLKRLVLFCHWVIWREWMNEQGDLNRRYMVERPKVFLKISSSQFYSIQQTKSLDGERDGFRISFSDSSLKCRRIVPLQLWSFTMLSQTASRATLMPFTSHDADGSHNTVAVAQFWEELLNFWKRCRVLQLFISFEMEQRAKQQQQQQQRRTQRDTHNVNLSWAVWAKILEVIVEKDKTILVFFFYWKPCWCSAEPPAPRQSRSDVAAEK